MNFIYSTIPPAQLLRENISLNVTKSKTVNYHSFTKCSFMEIFKVFDDGNRAQFVGQEERKLDVNVYSMRVIIFYTTTS